MDTLLYKENIAGTTTEEELRALITQVGEVVAIKINKDRVSGASKGFGYLTMSALSEADKAVGRFNSYRVSGQALEVRLASPRAQRGINHPNFEP